MLRIHVHTALVRHSLTARFFSGVHALSRSQASRSGSREERQDHQRGDGLVNQLHPLKKYYRSSLAIRVLVIELGYREATKFERVHAVQPAWNDQGSVRTRRFRGGDSLA